MELGDPDPFDGTPDERGRRLARLVADQRRIVFLDGLEVLQTCCEVYDRSVAALLSEMATQVAGLVVVTTRMQFALAAPLNRALKHITLGKLSRSQAVAVSGGKLGWAETDLGSDAAFVPLDLNLYAAWRDVTDDPERRLPSRGCDDAAACVLDAIHQVCGGRPEWRELLALGLFEQEAGIPLAAYSHACGRQSQNVDFQPTQLVRLLADHQLIEWGASNGAPTISTHSALRTYLRDRLAAEPSAWRAGHARLFDFYRESPPGERADTVPVVERMMLAVRHGCHAGLHRRALDLYSERVSQDDPRGLVASYRLGLVGSNIHTLSHFFRRPWAGWADAADPGEALDTAGRQKVIQLAAFDLWHICRFDEARAAFNEMGVQGAVAVREGNPGAWTKGSSAKRLHCEIDLVTGRLGDLPPRLERLVADATVRVESSGSGALILAVTRTLLARSHHFAGRPEDARREYERALESLPPDPGFDWLACELWVEHGGYERAVRRVGSAFTDPGSRFYRTWHLHLGHMHAVLTRTAAARAMDCGAVHRELVDYWAAKAVYHLGRASQFPHYPTALAAQEEWCQLLLAFGQVSPSPAPAGPLADLRRVAAEFSLRPFIIDGHVLAASRNLLSGADIAGPLAAAARLADETGYRRRAERLHTLRKAEKHASDLPAVRRILYNCIVTEFADKQQVGWYELRGVPVREQLAEELLAGESPTLRLNAARLLGTVGIDDSARHRVVGALASAAFADTDDGVRRAAAESLRHHASRDAELGATLSRIALPLGQQVEGQHDDLGGVLATNPALDEAIELLRSLPDDADIKAVQRVVSRWKGKSFGSFEANKLFCQELWAALRQRNFRVECTKHAGQPAILRCRSGTGNPTGFFAFAHGSPAPHGAGSGSVIPRLRLLKAAADLRFRSNQA